MEENEIIKFDYTAQQLKDIVAETSSIVTVDIDNKEELAIVKKNKLSLGKIRNALKEFGKSKRDYFNEMSKKIIAREKELVAIVEEEEDRLDVFLEEAKQKQELADRILVLPDRKEQLSKIEDGIEVTDGFILSLNAGEFIEYVNNRKTEYLNAKELKLNEEKAKIERDTELREAEKKARLEAEEQAKREIELSKQKAELDKQEALRKAEVEKQEIIDENNRKEKERLEAEEKKKADELEKVKIEKDNQDKLESQKKYQKFLKDNNYNENEDYLLNKENKVVLMRKVAEFIK